MKLAPAALICALFLSIFLFSRPSPSVQNIEIQNDEASVSFNAGSGLLTLRHHNAETIVALTRSEGEERAPMHARGHDATWRAKAHVAIPVDVEGALRAMLHLELEGAALRIYLETIPGVELRPVETLALSFPNTRGEGSTPEKPARIALLRTPNPTAVAAPEPFRAEQDEEQVHIHVRDRVVLATDIHEGYAYEPLLAAMGERPVRIEGRVTSRNPSLYRARVRGYDSFGMLQVEALAESDGSFTVFATKETMQWTATYGASSESAEARYVPGEDTHSLRLEAAPGGLLTIRVVDADGGKPLVSRVILRGSHGTLDPNLGPEFRASGAGPIADVLRGEYTTPLPIGTYRILATKGIEWSIDSAEVELKSGEHKTILLEPRHVVPTPTSVGCDLHVHARPSFDTLVTTEDRVLSLVAAGVDFAVPTEHNIVGDYGDALRFLGLARDLAYVPGVEVTPFAPRFGHFGVFPWPTRGEVPPFRKTTPNAVFNAVRRDHDPDRILQVNHPWLLKQIGYFEVEHVDTKSGRHELKARMDFDAMEVLNGFEIEHVDAVERSITGYMDLLNLGRRYVATGSSDSHHILYGWAGYPRTYANIGEYDANQPLDPMRVVRALKRGHASISAGPILSFTVGSAGPGDVARTRSAHLEVHAAPWVDVRSVEVIVDGRVAAHRDVAKRETRTGKEPGTHAEAEARTLRFAETFDLPIPEGAHWAIAVARGEETLDRYLPSTHIRPIAFTNPIWLQSRVP